MRPDFHILLIEDNPADVKIIERALREAGVQHRLTVIHDGRRALEYLKRLEEPSIPADREPDLVLLDLNLPGIDGGQILAEIKGNIYLKAIPVVVLTTSKREEDILSTYQAGANTYIEKPSEFPRYRDLVVTLRAYWHETAPASPSRATSCLILADCPDELIRSRETGRTIRRMDQASFEFRDR